MGSTVLVEVGFGGADRMWTARGGSGLCSGYVSKKGGYRDRICRESDSVVVDTRHCRGQRQTGKGRGPKHIEEQPFPKHEDNDVH